MKSNERRKKREREEEEQKSVLTMVSINAWTNKLYNTWTAVCLSQANPLSFSHIIHIIMGGAHKLPGLKLA